MVNITIFNFIQTTKLLVTTLHDDFLGVIHLLSITLQQANYLFCGVAILIARSIDRYL